MTDIPHTLPLPIDRRPVRMISCWTGNYDDNPLGLAPWWADEEWRAGFAHQVETAFNKGYRRLMLILPAGHQRGQRLMPSSQWLTMPEERREWLASWLPVWKDSHPVTKLYVYAGFALADQTSLRMPEPEHEYTPSLERDWQWFQDNWRGWIEDCGIDGIGFDGAAEVRHRAAFVDVARALSIAGIKCIGEAIPTRTGGTDLPIGIPAGEVHRAPWFALAQFVHQRDPDRRWRFDPDTTECGVGLRESMKIAGDTARMPVTEYMIRDWVARGLIPYVYAAKWDNLVMELAATDERETTT